MMEHNLEDSLKLDSAMGEMDFENPGDVVHQSDITLESGHDGNMHMEFENIEEQQMLMDTGNEEIIGFMGDQFTLQQYSIQDDQSHDVGEMVDASQLNVMSSQSETLIDLQFEPQTIVASSRQDIVQQPKYISVKAAIPPLRAKKPESTPLASVPRQVAIAPKPPKMLQVAPPKSLPGKHYAIAPKPVSLIANRTPNFKKVSLAGTVQGNMKGTAVITQIGKQLVMVPSGSGQKIKLVAANTGMSSMQYVRSSSDSAQLIATTSKSISGIQTTKPMMTKVVVQGQQNESSNQPAVITKLLPSTGAGSGGPTRYVMQQKTVPINIGGNKLLLASPTKQGIKFSKKQQIIAIKSPTPKLMPATSQATTTKKVVITANPNQNVILKTTAPPKTAQINKDGNVVVQGQRSQLHQINVPGKGIQYIRLITNPTPSAAKPAVKQQTSALTIPKNFVLTDTKGNVIQMTAEKMVQPPPLVRNDASNKLAPQKKFVRIAPLNTKVTQPSTQPARSSQSLLAPLSPMAETSTSLDVSELLDHTLIGNNKQDENEEQEHVREEAVDTKDSLRALVASTLAEEPQDIVNFHEIEVEYERQRSPTDEEDSNSMEPDESKSLQHPLIVIPPGYIKPQNQSSQDTSGNSLDDSKDLSSIVDVDGDMMRPYDMSPQPSQSLSETEFASNELDLRPRKACNCTKSQCLKLYCDCFANGEFCNRCNCNNCHNNLENEELRQKAIRACLDRNPNAFRPKIGKAKSGGPEIVRRHNKGCNCKRSGCLKNYCECYEAKIACTATCKCVGCRNVEETLQRLRLPRVRDPRIARDPRAVFRPPPLDEFKQPCSFMTSEVIEAVCQCLVAAAAGDADAEEAPAAVEPDPVGDVIDEFARCLQDIISASYQAIPLTLMEEGQV